MAKVICLFNHKGGVSKTTTAFNLGWMMAQKGKKVVLADFDPQCNLTGMVMGFRGIDDLEAVYQSDPPNNVKDGLSPAFESKPRPIVPIACVDVPGNDKLILMPGHIGLAEYETTLGVAQELSGSLLPLRNTPGAIRFLLDETANANGADYVIVDMSPSLGPINQNVLTTSDYFLVPLHPDYFSAMALSSLATAVPRWQHWAEMAYGLDVLANADYPFPKPHAKFIGSVIQKYRPRNGRASQAFQHWIDQLVNGLQITLVPALEKAGMLDAPLFKRLSGIDPWEPLLEVQDFNSLIAYSQQYQVPVFALTESQLKQGGAVWAQTKELMDKFAEAFEGFAERIVSLTSD